MSPSPLWIRVTSLVMVTFLAIFPAVLVELFPTETDLTAYAISLNLGASLTGGTSLLVCTWLIDVSGNLDASALSLGMSALLSAIALGLMRDRDREPVL